VSDACHRLCDGVGHGGGPLPISLQQVKRNALRRLATNAWHAAQCFDQANQKW
jgi:hypothetical protein